MSERYQAKAIAGPALEDLGSSKFLLIGLAVGLVWWLASQMAMHPAFQVNRISLWFPPSGLTMATAMALGSRFLPFIIIAGIAIAVQTGTWLDVASIFRHVAIYGFAAWAVAALRPTPGMLVSLRDLSVFVAVSLVAAPLAALCGIGLVALFGFGAWDDLLSILPAWSVGDALGVIMIAPCAYAVLMRIAHRMPGRALPDRSRVKAMAVEVAVVVAGVIAAFGLPSLSDAVPQIWYLVILLPIIVGLRSGSLGAAVAVLMTNLTVPAAVHLFGTPAAVFDIQVLLLVTSISGLLMGAAISDRDAALAHVKASEQALDATVSERTRDLQQAVAARTHLLASISHDLRQPAQALKMYLTALVQQTVGSAGAETAAKGAQVVDRLTALLNKLLDLSKLDADLIQPELRVFPVEQALQRVDNTFRSMAQAKGIALRVVSSGLWVESDPVLLDRIIGNVVENAIKHTKAGGVVVGCRRRARDVVVQVSDTGPGIAAEDRSAVFEQFRQGAAARGNGLGLGLYIVAQAARLLDHPVDLRTVVGKGTTVSVIVPRRAPQSPAAVPNPEVPADCLNATVLVVDDDAAVLDALSATMSANGCRVVVARSHAEALSLLATMDAAPDLIITDYRLPDGRRGTETLDQARKVLGYPVPGLVVTGETGHASVDDLTARGVPFLHKPISPGQLTAAVRVVLLASEGTPDSQAAACNGRPKSLLQSSARNSRS